MKTCCYYLTLLFVVFSFSACSNEIDVLADYEESAVVYGLLDPSQPIQLIKINKVFTNPNASAADIAKIADSLYFDTLAPYLTEIGTGRAPIQLYRANILLKDDGYFASSPNYLYATKEKISSKHDYSLDMTLPKTHKHIFSATNIPDSIRIASPTSIYASIIDIPAEKFTIVFNTTLKSKIFDVFFYFNYLEVNKADTNIKISKTVKWRMINKQRANSDQSVESIKNVLATASFYDLVLSVIPADAAVERHFLPCKLELSAGNLELDNYIQVTEPSIGIVQKSTDYTNINNGLGVFASRRASVYNNLRLGDKTKDIFFTGTELKKLGFVQ